MVYNDRVKEGENNQVDKQLVWVQLTKGRKRGRYYGLPGVIDRNQIGNSANAPSGSMETQTLYTQQQVQDIVQQAVTNAVHNAHQELASRIERLEQTVDKDKAETHSHVSIN